MSSLAAAMSALERRKRKKELKKALNGRLGATHTLTQEDIRRLYGTASASFEIPPHTHRPRLLTVNDVQTLLLWLLDAVPSPPWVMVRNKALIRACVCMCVYGVNHAELMRYLEALPPHSDSALQRCTRYQCHVPKGLWRSHHHQINDCADVLLHTDTHTHTHSRAHTHASASGDAEASGAHAGNKRRRAAGESHFDDAEHMDRASAVYDMCLTLEEMHAHAYPLAVYDDEGGGEGEGEGAVEGGGEGGVEARGKGADVAEGRAGAAAASVLLADARHHATEDDAVCAGLRLPAGYIATRCAMRDCAYAWARVHQRKHEESGGAAASTTRRRPRMAGDFTPQECSTPRLLAIDCEMCRTASGKQLARVSVVDEDETVVLDELIKPTEPIIDYVTQYSGLTAAQMAHAKMTFTEAQEAVRRLVDGSEDANESPAVLVGHSLENDLRALRLVHTRALDTSILHPHPGGLPFRHSLRHLSRVRLQRAIQEGHGNDGHNSVEDALATLHLMELLLPPRDSVPSASSPEVPRKSAETYAFERWYSRPARPDLVPIPGLVAPWQLTADESAVESPTAEQAPVADGRGVAAVLAVTRAGMGAAADAADTTADGDAQPRRSWQRRRRPASIFTSLAFKSSAVSGTTLIGPADFVRHHVGGNANGIPVPDSDNAPKRCLEKAGHEIARYVKQREDGAVTGLGIVVAGIRLPLLDPVSSRLAAFDVVLGAWLRTLPPGCAVMCLMQHPVGAVPASDKDAATGGLAAAYGSVMLHVTSCNVSAGGPPEAAEAAEAAASPRTLSPLADDGRA